MQLSIGRAAFGLTVASCSGKSVDAAVLAVHLTLLFEGVYASVQALGAEGPAKRARLVASLLGT